jgi:hypothetical protein
MLDPACGSMHFGLYAFDLFEVIYEEARELEEVGTAVPSRPPGMKSLHDTYPDKQAFLRDVPRLIIEHNIHGIEIDSRCVQIAGLSLWLRAQRAWKNQKIPAADRPQIRRSNIVCAEPMPGEKDLLRDFVEQEFRAEERGVFLRLLETIFDQMQLAGEAGSLLKIEEEIRTTIEEAKQAWEKLQSRPAELFSTSELNAVSKQPELDATLDLLPLASDFWQTAETRLLAALRDYAEQAENGGGFQRRLFAEDAARGFAFIDVCRKRYDVALMNPPFGDPCKSSKPYLQGHYRGHPCELYADFVERFASKTDKLGAITSHSFLTYGSLTEYRTQILLPKTRMRLLAHFGLGVMDAAMVRSAAYVMDSSTIGGQGIYFRLVEDEDKVSTLQFCLRTLNDNRSDLRRFIADQSLFYKTDQCSYAYWAADSLLDRFDRQKGIGVLAADIVLGVVTSGNEQFLRLLWEVAPNAIGRNAWAFYYKAGGFQKFFRAPQLVIDWRGAGAHIAAGNASAVRLRDTRQYFRSGLTFPLVNEFGISVSVLPGNCIFDNTSPSVFAKGAGSNLFLLGLLNSRIAEFFIRCLTDTRHWQVGYVRQLPWPSPAESEVQDVSNDVLAAIALQRRLFEGDEIVPEFTLPALLETSLDASLHAKALDRLFARDHILRDLLSLDLKIDEKCCEVFHLTPAQQELVKRIIGPHPLEIEGRVTASAEHRAGNHDEEADDLRIHRVTLSGVENTAWKTGTTVKHVIENRHSNIGQLSEEIVELVSEALSYFVGVGFGRWDIRFATREKHPLDLPDPFAQLPVCPPGMLQNAQRLPATLEDLPAAYPVPIPWDGILVDDFEKHGGATHPFNIELRVRKVVEAISPERAEAIEHEACQLLGVRSLRDYLRKPAGFFADHLKRYSKSHRQAPIYWPLSTASGTYTLWVYYHRLTDQTLHTALADFVDPKIKSVERDVEALRERAGGGGSQVGELQEFLDELKEFRAEIDRIIKLPWKPDLNDGVLVTASPLWKLFRLPKWRKDLEACWKELESGEYDWAHLAHTIWPDRVKEKCKADRSLAIAHGLETICQVAVPVPKAKRGRKKQVELEGLEE